MAPSGKERVSSPTLSTITVGIFGTAATTAINLVKTPVPDVSKPEPFFGFR
jgi:hypothetical protein